MVDDRTHQMFLEVEEASLADDRERKSEEKWRFQYLKSLAVFRAATMPPNRQGAAGRWHGSGRPGVSFASDALH